MTRIYGIPVIVLLFISLISACSSDQGNEASSGMEKQAVVSGEDATGLTKAESSDSKVKAVASYSEVKSIMKRQTDVTEDYIKGLTDAKNADDVVKVIDNFTEGMKKLMPDLLEFQKKYPEYKEGKVPEELEADVKKMENISAKMGEAMMKMSQYMMDPKVQEAMTRMGEEMDKLGN